MNVIKNIFFVSYLKNKGVRRICFVIGILSSIITAIIWYEGLEKKFYNETYENIIEFGKQNKYNTDKLRKVFYKYPANIGIKNLDTFHAWQTFFFSDHSKGYLYYAERCHIYSVLKHDIISQIDKEFIILQELCPKLENYISQKIRIPNYLYLFKLLWSLFWFYLPFLSACIGRWIYRGFKEK